MVRSKGGGGVREGGGVRKGEGVVRIREGEW